MDIDDILLLTAAFRARRRRPTQPPVPFAATRRPIKEWLSSPTLLFNTTGLRLQTLQRLCVWLRQNTILDNGKNQITLEEKVLIFLHICRKGAGYRETQITFNHSTETISRAFHDILKALVRLHKEVVQQPKSHDPTPIEIVDNPKLWPYFKDCIGAVDGTHIHIYVPTKVQAPWRNRKGFHSQNIFAACSFDLRFTFIYPGWEGSAHDSTVVSDALAKGYWKPPTGKYFLADAGYTTSEHLLIPYNKTRYHLREQAAASQRPQDQKELFNLRHAQLRNVIERIFGILKKKFKILTTAAEFDINTQIDLILVLTALFNFITDSERLDDEDFNHIEQFDTDGVSQCLSVPSFSTRQSTARTQMLQFQESIARKMWDDYQHYIKTRYWYEC
jgi:hypothetical protein